MRRETKPPTSPPKPYTPPPPEPPSGAPITPRPRPPRPSNPSVGPRRTHGRITCHRAPDTPGLSPRLADHAPQKEDRRALRPLAPGARGWPRPLTEVTRFGGGVRRWPGAGGLRPRAVEAVEEGAARDRRQAGCEGAGSGGLRSGRAGWSCCVSFASSGVELRGRFGEPGDTVGRPPWLGEWRAFGPTDDVRDVRKACSAGDMYLLCKEEASVRSRLESQHTIGLSPCAD